MPSTGWKLATAQSVDTLTGTAWTSPGNITTDDGLEVTEAITAKNTPATGFTTGGWLHGTSLGFDAAIPNGSTIDQVQIRMEYRVNSTGGIANPELAAFLDGAGIGTAPSPGNPLEPTTLTINDFDITSARTWRRSNLLNGRFELRCRGRNGNSATDPSYRWDYIAANVTYTTPTGITDALVGTGATGTTSVTPGNPAGVSTGDLKILIVNVRATGDISPSITTPSGWSALGTGTFDAGAPGVFLQSFARFHAGDAGPTISPTNAANISALILAYPGGDTPTNFAYSNESVSQTLHTTSNVTIGAATSWALAAFGDRTGYNYTSEVKTTERAEVIAGLTETLFVEDSDGTVATGAYAAAATGSVATSTLAMFIAEIPLAPLASSSPQPIRVVNKGVKFGREQRASGNVTTFPLPVAEQAAEAAPARPVMVIQNVAVQAQARPTAGVATQIWPWTSAPDEPAVQAPPRPVMAVRDTTPTRKRSAGRVTTWHIPTQPEAPAPPPPRPVQNVAGIATQQPRRRAAGRITRLAAPAQAPEVQAPPRRVVTVRDVAVQQHRRKSPGRIVRTTVRAAAPAVTTTPRPVMTVLGTAVLRQPRTRYAGTVTMLWPWISAPIEPGGGNFNATSTPLVTAGYTSTAAVTGQDNDANVTASRTSTAAVTAPTPSSPTLAPAATSTPSVSDG